MEIGQILREKRKALGWTQGVAAQKIGIQQSYLSKLENNQFIPSQEVLEQLSEVYQVELPLLQSPDNNSKSPFALVSVALVIYVLFSTSIIAIGQSGLVFSHTYYTYEAKLINEVGVNNAMQSYELTDEYRGEVYQAKFAGKTYRYKLLGSRQIVRKENTLLSLSGVFLLIIGLSGYFIKLRKG